MNPEDPAGSGLQLRLRVSGQDPRTAPSLGQPAPVLQRLGDSLCSVETTTHLTEGSSPPSGWVQEPGCRERRPDVARWDCQRCPGGLGFHHDKWRGALRPEGLQVHRGCPVGPLSPLSPGLPLPHASCIGCQEPSPAMPPAGRVPA